MSVWQAFLSFWDGTIPLWVHGLLLPFYATVGYLYGIGHNRRGLERRARRTAKQRAAHERATEATLAGKRRAIVNERLEILRMRSAIPKLSEELEERDAQLAVELEELGLGPVAPDRVDAPKTIVKVKTTL